MAIQTDSEKKSKLEGVLASALVFILAMLFVPTLVRTSALIDLSSVFGSGPTMRYNSAIALFALSVSILGLLRSQTRTANVFSSFTLVLSALTIVEWVAGVDLHFDQIFRLPGASGDAGRIIFDSAISFGLLAVALLLSSGRDGRRNAVAGLAAMVTIAMGLVALFGAKVGFGGAPGLVSYVLVPKGTAFAQVLVGLYIWRRCVQRLRASEPYSYLYTPTLVTASVLAASVLMWQYAVSREAGNLNRTINLVTEDSIHDFRDSLRSTSAALARFGSRIEVLGASNAKYLEVDSRNYVQQLKFLVRIGITDTKGNVVWSYPENLKSQVDGFNQNSEEARHEAFEQARRTRQPTLSRSIDLRSGSKGHIMAVALYRHDRFVGSVYSTYDTSKLFSNIYDVKDFHFTVTEAGKSIFASASSAPIVEMLAQDFVVKTGFSEWHFHVVPTEAYVARTSTATPAWILFIGALIALLIGSLLSTVSRSLKERWGFVEKERDTLENLRLAHDRMERLIVATGEGVWERELDTRKLRYIDDQARKIMMIDPSRPPDLEEIYSRIFEDDREKLAAAIKANVERTIASFDLEFRIRDSVGATSFRWIRTKGQVMIREGQTERHLLATVGDVTEAVLTRERLEQAIVAADAATKAKSAFLASMSHEIRTPLNGVIGMAGLLLETEMKPEQREYVEIVRQSGSSLLSLINDVLDFSKIESGKMDLAETEFDLGHLIEGQVDILAVKAKEKGLGLASYISPQLPKSLLGDPGRVGQIVLNLLGNAIKFTVRGGVIIRVTPETVDQQRFVRFEIQDTGIGLSPSDKLKLFKPFTQANAMISGQFGGTGLGLSISKKLVEAMQGSIGAISSKEDGSTFFFRIPLRSPQPVSASLTHIQAALPRAGIRGLLLVERDPISREALEAYFRAYELPFETVRDLAAASSRLSRAGAGEFNVVLIASESSSEASAWSREQAARQIKVIYIPDFGSGESTESLLSKGFDSLVRKPAKRSQLVGSIRGAIEGRKMEGPKSAPAAFVTAPSASDSKVHVLIADDNPVNQLLARKTVESFGYTTTVVANGLEVLQALETTRFDLILMDCQMPEMDGYEATAILRKHKRSEVNSLPVIALTANALETDAKKCFENGMNDYLTKPFQKAKLKEVMLKWLRPNDEVKAVA